MRRAVLLPAALLVGAAGGGAAQSPPPDTAGRAPAISIAVRRDSAGAPSGALVRAERLMADGIFEGALRNGFPVRFGFRVGLWRDGRLFDREEGSAAWEAVVILDPVSGTYELVRSGGTVESFAAAAAVDVALATPAAVELPPARGDGRYYYVVAVVMESLSVSELQEVERWLRGDLGRAITERGDIGNALGRGARLVLVRLSGLPHRRLEARTSTFAVSPP